MSLHELREMLREHRKENVPAVSRMKKADVVAELERAKVRREKKVEKELHEEEEHVEKELKKDKVPKTNASFPKAVVKKVVAVEKKQVRAMKKEEETMVEPSIKHSRSKK